MTRGFSETAWRRFGRDRTYVTETATGHPLGYRDNATGDLVPESADTLRLLREWVESSAITEERPSAVVEGSRAVVDQLPSRLGSGATQPGESSLTDACDGELLHELDEPASPADPGRIDWTDLSGHRPGEGARAKAEAELAARRANAGRFRTWAGRVLDVHTDERAWRIGAAAEESVGKELETLTPHGWRALHSVPVGAGESDIDHILIGPGGVITVNTKHHPDANVWVTSKQVRINGNYVPYLRNSRHEATRASRLLSREVGFPVPTLSCLVFRLREGKITLKEDPVDVLVLRATRAAKTIRSRTGILSPGEVEQLFEVARRSTTWTA